MKQKVQILMEENNLTQSELAEQSGLSLRTIQRIEAGTIPKGFTLKSLAAALHVAPEALSQDDGQAITLDRVKLINISALSFLILPFGNVLIPAILTYKTKEPLAKDLGKGIVGIQIIWTTITSVSMIACPFLQKLFPTPIPLFVVVLIVLICINVLVIMKNGASLNEKSVLSIRLKNNIL